MLLLLGLGADPTDVRLVGLAEALLNHPDCPPETLVGLFDDTIRSELWHRLIEQGLGAPGVTHPSLAALRAKLARP